MRLFIICLSVFLSQPALADITATYETPDKRTWTEELADNGDLRTTVSDKPGAYILTRNGQCYAVIPTAAGSVVDRCEDMMAAFTTVMEELAPGYRKMMSEAASAVTTRFGGRSPFIKGEEVTVRGHTGTAWYQPGFNGAPFGPPVVVISQDPELAPLGRAMGLQSKMFLSTPTMAFFRQVGEGLKAGTPISMGNGFELTTVSHDQIKSSRFELPRPPETVAEIAKRLRANSKSGSIQVY